MKGSEVAIQYRSPNRRPFRPPTSIDSQKITRLGDNHAATSSSQQILLLLQTNDGLQSPSN
jgi:hypothetical protein